MTSYIPADLRLLVKERASDCCEYCLLPQNANYLSHEADHIISEKHGGETSLQNLCLSCFECNRYKGSDVGSIDPDTGEFISLFNPCKMKWTDHFRLNEGIITPLTPIGRVTVFLLRMNSSKRITKRTGLIEVGQYPCMPIN